jgi:hypothetical protein
LLKKIIQILLGVLTSIVVNALFVLKYFYFALDVLKGNTNYTIAEFSKFTTYENMILIPLSYTTILGLVNFLIYKFTNSKYFSIAFFIIGVVITWFLYLVFPSMLWF